jgi:hypothetical protein
MRKKVSQKRLKSPYRKNTGVYEKKSKKNKKTQKSFLQKKKNMAISRSIKNSGGVFHKQYRNEGGSGRSKNIFESLID